MTGPVVHSSAFSRRSALQRIGAGLAIATVPALAGAQSSRRAPAAPRGGTSDVLMRTIPKTSERIPAIGLGTFMTFDRIPGTPRAPLGDVMRVYWEGGARLIDTSPLYGSGETTVGDFATALGINEQIFVSNKIWATGEYLADDSHIRRSLDLSASRLWREKIDLMQCHSLVNVDVVVPHLKAWKGEGLIRYLGVTHHENVYHPALLNWVERGELDFLQVNYSIFNRAAEERLLPAAQERGVAVTVNMPFEKARLFKVVEGRSLPDFARDIGAETWAAFFLKFVLSHPAVVCALPATSDPAHASENVAALRGPLPDAAMRRRMIAHMEQIPGFSDIGSMPWYPGKRYPGLIARSQAALRARS